ncbi:MAG: FtsX-like permease family protein [Gammaproteobacteria bacterium]
MKVLTLKLLRDLWRLRSQSLAISIVIASGIATYIMSVSTLNALQRTRAAVYTEYRFSDIFTSLKRAPERELQRIKAIPGVKDAESRVIASVRMQVAGFSDPVIGKLVSIPSNSDPVMNALYMRKGRRPEPGKEEVLLSEPFANAHQLQPGDHITAIINGHRESLRISGIALSPEYIYNLGPGAMFPDDKRFGILWMDRHILATAYDMDGAFNDVVLKLDNSVNPKQVMENLDRLLDKYGGAGAYPRKDQQSHHFLNQEFRGLETMAILFPVIFLGVAAFLLNVVMTRLINTEREQIAVFKAFGYSNFRVALHYLWLVMIITAMGVTAGLLLGYWLGNGLGNLYMNFFHFPYLDYRLDISTVLIAFVISFIAAITGTLHAVYRAASLPPAEAMHPEPPASYHESLFERTGIKRFLSQPTRMILRHMGRKPVKTGFTVLGIAMAGAIVMLGNFQGDAIDYMLHVQFNLAQREDLTVTFTQPTSRKAQYELASLPGVAYAEPFRYAPVRLHFRQQHRRTTLQGFESHSDLHRVLNTQLQPFTLPSRGIVLNDYLAQLLGARTGDRVTVEILSGRRPKLEVEVIAIVEEMLGIPAYMHLDALNRLLGEGDAIDGVFLDIDQQQQDKIYRELRDMPGVAGITIKEAAVQSAHDTMGDTILIFTFINTLLATGIAFGVIYNSVRIAYSERSRELASLRVLGFRHSEVAYILLGELAFLTLIAIPPGFMIGKLLCSIIATEMASDLYRIPLIIEPASYGFSATVVLVSAIISSLIIWQKLKRLDLVTALKTRE